VFVDKLAHSQATRVSPFKQNSKVQLCGGCKEGNSIKIFLFLLLAMIFVIYTNINGRVLNAQGYFDKIKKSFSSLVSSYCSQPTCTPD